MYITDDCFMPGQMSHVKHLFNDLIVTETLGLYGR